MRVGIGKTVAVAAAVLTVGGLAAGAMAWGIVPSWPVAGQNIHNTSNQAFEYEISPNTAGHLKVKWSFETGGDVWMVKPAVDQNAVYVSDRAGNFYAIDRETGTEIWSRTVASWTGAPGDSVRATPAIVGDELIFGDQGGRVGAGAKMLAVDKNTGDLVWMTQIDAHPAALVTQSAVVFNGRVYVGVASQEEFYAAIVPGYQCCSFRGSVLSLDAATGAILWKTYTVPGAEHPGFSGGAVWGSTPVVDVRRGSIYVTTGNNYTVPQAIIDCAALGDPTEVQQCVAGVPGAADDHIDSIMALDMNTGHIRWATQTIPFDNFTVACVYPTPNVGNCSSVWGPDYDFGQGAMLYWAQDHQGHWRQLLGAGQKSGIFWALDPSDGSVVWSTQVGPGGTLGGLQWGSATDGKRIYTSISNNLGIPWTLPSGETVTGGFWSALDAATGQILWQTAGDPAVTTPNPAPVTVANGVVFGGTLDANGTMYALDAATGQTLWTFESGGSIISGASIVQGTVYWGSGYGQVGLGLTGNNELYAFSIDGQ